MLTQVRLQVARENKRVFLRIVSKQATLSVAEQTLEYEHSRAYAGRISRMDLATMFTGAAAAGSKPFGSSGTQASTTGGAPSASGGSSARKPGRREQRRPQSARPDWEYRVEIPPSPRRPTGSAWEQRDVTGSGQGMGAAPGPSRRPTTGSGTRTRSPAAASGGRPRPGASRLGGLGNNGEPQQNAGGGPSTPSSARPGSPRPRRPWNESVLVPRRKPGAARPGIRFGAGATRGAALATTATGAAVANAVPPRSGSPRSGTQEQQQDRSTTAGPRGSVEERPAVAAVAGTAPATVVAPPGGPGAAAAAAAADGPGAKGGDKVETRYKGKDTWLAGEITAVNTDGTYEILYDDGDREYNVKADMVRVKGPGTASDADLSKAAGPSVRAGESKGPSLAAADAGAAEPGSASAAPATIPATAADTVSPGALPGTSSAAPAVAPVAHATMADHDTAAAAAAAEPAGAKEEHVKREDTAGDATSSSDRPLLQ
jgi:hypothetical protein